MLGLGLVARHEAQHSIFPQLSATAEPIRNCFPKRIPVGSRRQPAAPVTDARLSRRPMAASRLARL